MPAALAASCGTHTEKPAVATCRRCGLFLCDGCIVLALEDCYCANCARIVEAPPTRRAALSALLPFAAGLSALAFKLPAPATYLMLVGPPLWAIGLALWFGERRSLKAQADQPRRRFWLRMANAALILSAPTQIPAVLFVFWMVLGKPEA